MIMKKIISFFIWCGLFLSSFWAGAQELAPADQRAVVHAGDDVRFTVLSPGLIRMEWSAKGHFTDEATFVVVNRKTEVPEYKVRKSKKYMTLITDSLELVYRLGTGKFTEDNLSIRSRGRFSFEWKPGTEQQNNLLGTSRTLDGCNGDVKGAKKVKLQLEEGIISRDGWYLLDDSESLLFDGAPEPWVKERTSGDCQDWYFFAYGHNYKKALKEYSNIAGRIPLPPKYAFGFWWSRYWSYSDKELRDLVNKYESYGMPMDVLVIDMDWHTTDSTHVKDEFGWSKSWTGWTWNRRLFPEPEKFLSWAKSKNLSTTLNLHPSSGIAPFEEKYNEFAEKIGFDTSSGRNIPFVGSDRKFMDNLFEIVLDPIAGQGVDFWWLDWQQWAYDKQLKKLNNTWWLNYNFFTRMEKHSDKRPLIYHRWGGLGNHRYQIGFSGDTYTTWNSLEYQPYFTSTASNVLYGYWSHDIGGHMGGGDFDEELFVRWFQYGVFSPILRTHCSKRAAVTFNKEPWTMSHDAFEAYRDALALRYSLVPYIYTMARHAYDTGVSICRPMYYDYPDEDEAYAYSRQYQFGDNMIVAPIGKKSDPATGKSTVRCWLPEGNKWYEWSSGTLFHGGQEIEREFNLDEYPVYVKAGSIIPMYGHVTNLKSIPDNLVVSVFPGDNGEFVLYEDSGNDKDYSINFARTRMYSEIREGEYTKLFICPRTGNYEGMKSMSGYELRFVAVSMPSSVVVNGKEIDFDENLEKADSWRYDGSDLSVIVRLASRPVSEEKQITVYYDKQQYMDVTNGLVGKFRHLTDATVKLKYKAFKVILPSPIGELEETSIMLEYNPDSFKDILTFFNREYDRLPEHIDAMEHVSEDVKEWYKANYK